MVLFFQVQHQGWEFESVTELSPLYNYSGCLFYPHSLSKKKSGNVVNAVNDRNVDFVVNLKLTGRISQRMIGKYIDTLGLAPGDSEALQMWMRKIYKYWRKKCWRGIRMNERDWKEGGRSEENKKNRYGIWKGCQITCLIHWLPNCFFTHQLSLIS